MARPISNDKREAIIKHMQAGENKKEIAKWLFVCERTVTRIWNKFKAVGSYEPNPQNSGRKPMVSEETMNRVMAKRQQEPDKTLQELVDEFDLGISQSALCRRLIKSGLTFKKRRFILTGKNERML